MKTVNVVHLASFEGNIGDKANHNGFYSALRSIDELTFTITPLEIRKFYWKEKLFDQGFVDYVNQFDLLVIGGGNYFELWVEHSPTGTSIMIEPELYKDITVPVVFNALGVDPGQGASASACNKFRNFLDVIYTSGNSFVSIRNDGSMEALEQFIGKEYADRAVWTPDAGINVQCDDDFLGVTGDYLAVNLAGDMLDVRFPEKEGYISYDSFIEDIARVIIHSLKDKQLEQVVLIPHIYKDLKCINDLLEQLPDNVIRQQIIIAPLLNRADSEKKLFSIYKNAKLTLAMRFHANLCSIGLGVQTIGLANYRQIEQLYNELDLLDSYVGVNRLGFSDVLKEKISNLLISKDSKERYEVVAKQQREMYSRYLKKLAIFFAKHIKV